MRTKRTQTIALLALLIVLAAVLWFELRPAPAVSPAAPSNSEASRTPGGTPPPGGSPSSVAEVRLGDLAAPRPAPGDANRDPFRFKPKPPPPPPPQPTVAPQPTVMTAPGGAASGPPPPPPITLKFIGIVDAPGQIGKVAVLSDRGQVMYGREGDIVWGQYKIIKIGVESVEISYPDGRGRTTIRLTG
jgi:hypothetical protein